MSHIELIGISGESLGTDQRALIAGCVLVAHSRRQEPLLQGIAVERVAITPLAGLYTAIASALAKGQVAVLASGDPLFFGIGRNLLNRFGPEQVRVHPALSAVQLACSRFKIPWDDLALISLHGRKEQNPAARILHHQRALCFTDQHHSPDSLARNLIETLEQTGDHERLLGMRLRVAENLGLNDERLTAGSLAEIARVRFSPLNMVLFEQAQAPAAALQLASLPVFGLREAEIRHSRGLITKDEVRAASLHKLRLPAAGVLWDIGGGSGSVSLEAARMNPELAIYTVEKKQEEQDNICHNIRTYAAYSIRLVRGEAPEALVQLPDPDRVFIGGSGKRLEEILQAATSRLRPDGRIVVNAVLAATRDSACSILTELGFTVECSTITVVRHQPQTLPDVPESAAQPYNPITIVTGSP